MRQVVASETGRDRRVRSGAAMAGRTKALMLVAVLGVLTAGSPGAAQTAPKAKKTTAPESVAFEIDAAAAKFTKAVGDGLGQHLEELRATLKDAAARVRAALE